MQKEKLSVIVEKEFCTKREFVSELAFNQGDNRVGGINDLDFKFMGQFFFFYYAKNLNRPLIQMSSRRFAKNEHTSLKGHQYDVSQAPPMLKLVLTIQEYQARRCSRISLIRRCGSVWYLYGAFKAVFGSRKIFSENAIFRKGKYF